MTLDSELLGAALPAYELGGVLGRGAFGVVWAGTHRHLGRAVAIKSLSADIAADSEVRSRFLVEARVLASMDHPHIVPIHDFVEYEGVCLLVMEHLAGGTLWDRMRAGVDARFACAAVLAAASGLEYAHRRGVLHRDVKPENLMFSADGVLKVTDFGIARVVGGTLTRVGSAIGTPAYMAPEQARGLEVSAAADVYALGSVLFESLAGRLPFPSGDAVALLFQHVHEEPPALADVAPTVAVPLAAVVDRSIARSLEDRFSSAAAFAAALSVAAAQVWGSDWAAGPAMAPVSDPTVRSGGRAQGPGSGPTIGAVSMATVGALSLATVAVKAATPSVAADRVPSGVVTLLFTDIQGSTRAWEAHPDEMKVALGRHDEILRIEIEAMGGYVFKTVGDAFCAAFSEASAAIEAAVAIQRGLAGALWPEATPMRVRMGLHSGSCEERDGDYFGPVVNRTARLEAVAHGGQVVLSRVTAELCAGALPPGVSLLDMGEHHLKDLGRPERVFQVCGDGLASTFPPLRSLDNPVLKHNLTQQVSSFVGRDQELAQISTLLAGARLVTLAGPGGVGKTRLALAAAAESLDSSGDGAWFVDLAPIAEAGLVAASVATVLWVKEQPGRPLIDTLVEVLSDRSLLVVLDNCEQVIAAVAGLAQAILARCPRVVLLATSREPLGIGGEQVFRVPSLSLPAAGTADLSVVERCEAVRLFVERAAQQKPGFVLDAANAEVIARLCRRLDGIPFAIELAAARLRSMSVVDLDARLDRRLKILTGGSRTALPRQQTLKALIDFSWDLLGDVEKTVLARLSVFCGGFDLAAAEAVCPGGDVEDYEIMDTLDLLVDKSLVQADDTGASVRYRLLETMREYSGSKLVDQPAEEQRNLRTVHRDHYLALAEEAAAHLRGPGDVQWAKRLDVELDNLRAALAECLDDTLTDTSADGAPGLRLGVALSDFWDLRGHGIEGVDALRAQLDRPQTQAATLLRGQALAATARLMEYYMGDYAAAEAWAEEALGIARSVGDGALSAKALLVLAWARYRQGDHDGCLRYIDEALPIARGLDDPRAAAHLLNLQAHRLSAVGGDAGAAFDEAAALYHKAGDRYGAAVVLTNMGGSALVAGHFDVARRALGEAAGVFRELGHSTNLAICACNEGTIAYLEGADSAADGLFRECLDISRRIGSRPLTAYAILGLALTATRLGDARRGATLHGVFDARESPVDTLEAGLRDADHVRLRSLLGEGPFDLACQAGRRLSLDDAFALAGRFPEPATREPVTTPPGRVASEPVTSGP